MTPQEFLTRLLPEGLVVIAELAGKGFKHHVADSIESALPYIENITSRGRDCYFGLGSLKESQVWNPNWKRNGIVVGKWEIRVGRNIAALKSLFIDMDIDHDNPKKYSSQDAALAAIDQFVVDTGFPSPLVVSSGGGLHCYWPLDRAVPADKWRPVAATFKAALQQYGLKFDPSRTADASSVLRVVGTYNHKQTPSRHVTLLRDSGPYQASDISQHVAALATAYNISAVVAQPTQADTLGSNLERVYDPVDFRKVMTACPQIANVVRTGGHGNEPSWYATLAVARLCEEPEKAARFASKLDPDFNQAAMDKRLQNLEGQNTGPTLCTTFDSKLPGVCPICPHFGNVSSPIVLGRVVQPPVSAEDPIVILTDEDTGEEEELILPKAPFPFVRRLEGGIVMRNQNTKGEEEPATLVYDYDMYPMRRMVSEKSDTEQTIWRVMLPLIGWVEITIDQGVLADAGKLHGKLLEKGVYVHPAKTKLMVIFMVAYIKQLQQSARTEQIFSRLGWRDNNSIFVLGDRVYRAGQDPELHQISSDMKSEVPGLMRKGTLQGWKDAIQFYNAPDHQAYRFMLYGAFGSPLLHMTGNLGMIVNASGPTGTGKTRSLHVINSVWGHPTLLGLNGSNSGSTQNARYALISVYNSLPFCFDEITKLPNDDLAEIALTIDKGKGKIRATRSGSLQRALEAWALMMFTSANTDAYNSLMQSRRDATAEAARVLQLIFHLPTHYTQAQADANFHNGLMENYGQAGHIYAPYLVTNYDKIRKTVHTVMERTTQLGKMVTAERFYSAGIAATTVGAMVARKLGLLDDFPIERDWEWAIDQVPGTRTAIEEHHSTARDVMSEFLEQRIGETLIVSQTLAVNNIAPRIDQMPRGALTIRHETDIGLLYVTKAAFKHYCMDIGANYSTIQEALIASNILLDQDAKKVLGAGTDFGKGQVRCWILSVKDLQK